MRPLILGTAGHIDHGKTSLVKSLTGVDADRLPEERQRGMTIDLGFASMTVGDRTLGIIDVPGHERFIRNMVAGATGIDLVLLVVAADDGVMPQTREHLEIIDLLGVKRGLIALTKIDLADAPRIERAKADVRRLIEKTFLRDAPMIEVSSITGLGVEVLREAIAAETNNFSDADWPSLFRLPVDRCFTLQGHGTIVTGSLMGGDVKAGDEVQLWPRGKKVRVRSVQSHGTTHDALGRGRRVAINLPGIKTREVNRGDELAASGYLRPSERLAVRVRLLDSSPLELQSGEWLRVHIGARDVDAKFALIGRSELQPASSTLAIMQTRGSICATHGQPFIIRSPGHGVTVGGGNVIFSAPPKIKLASGAPKWLVQLESEDPKLRVLAALEVEPLLGADFNALSRETGVPHDLADAILDAEVQTGRWIRGPRGAGYFAKAYLDECRSEIIQRLRDRLIRSAPALSIEVGQLLRACRDLAQESILEWLLDEMTREGSLVMHGRHYGIPGYAPALSETQQRELAILLDAFQRGGLTPPAAEEIQQSNGAPLDRALLAFALERGDLIAIQGDYRLHRNVLDKALAALRDLLREGEGRTLSQIKEHLGLTRKHAVPLCEFFDRQGYTLRNGDLRRAGPNL